MNVRPISFVRAFLIFFLFGSIFAFNIFYVIPFITELSSINPFIVSQVANTFLVFIPIFVTPLILLKREGTKLNWKNVKERFNFKPLNIKDILWSLGSLCLAIIITILIIVILDFLSIPFDLSSLEEISPIKLRPLIGTELFFLFFMRFSFFFNYVGEELLWRGYLYVRQEPNFGKQTWIINGLLHAVFHFYMGYPVVLLLPILLAMPFVYSKTKNIYTVIIMHSILGAPTDILLAIGLLT